MSTVLVLGDSVPAGERTDATAWPHRLPDLVERAADARVAVRGGMATTLADLAVEATTAVDDAVGEGCPETGPAGETVVLVHAGHNDAQLSGGEPRVETERFRAAAARLDRTLADHAAVDRHAFVGLVPLLPDRGVPFADAQPDRSLDYDDALAECVGTHIPVARPVTDWGARTADGVHPNEAGHGHVAARVAVWLAGEA
ncbi:SGNH/GDSL hydrolase family protein [Halosimplex litoreum]|uniref:SGNH/GDSL hydrolase family protein n=1 Tax=Halosimplex litoreum TaxID=1198301 RepID=A0A7U3WAN3_9EURY|nr:SGNH/GDSL hydrolase family protein [Halosimplex litoreum]QPV64678.1 SGNH/GDSL hydrolase family protein [Halosimplex litoreum]